MVGEEPMAETRSEDTSCANRERAWHSLFHDLVHRSVRWTARQARSAAAISEMQKDGAGFAGFATWLDMTPAHPDMFGMPDPAPSFSYPGKRKSPGLPADCVTCRPGAARRTEERGRQGGVQGLRVKTGVERPDTSSPAPTAPLYRTTSIRLRSPATTSRLSCAAMTSEICDYSARARLGPVT